MNRTTVALIAVLCMAMVALAVAAIPTGTSSSSGNATTSEHQFHPFSGTPPAISDRIEAENYDKGGQGIAWFDRTPGNEGGAYREDDVDIETGGSGHVVAFVKSSEWLIYSVHVPENGMYRATFRASSPWDDRQIWVWVDGILEAQVKVKNTGSFDTYEDVSADVALPVGNHYIKLEFDRDAQNLDYMTFERTGDISTWPVSATGTSGQGTGGGGSSTGTVTPTQTGTVTPTSTGGSGGSGNGTTNVTPTMTGNVTPTMTSGQGSSGQGSGGNVTPTPTSGGSAGAGAPEATQYAADWPSPNRDYANSRASTDSPITAANVNSLNLSWAYEITGVGTYGGGASNPIILGDTIFFQDLKANVIALNKTTGAVKWMKEYNASFVEGPNGPTAGYGKIFAAKDAYTMAALNATTGDELWSQRLSFVNTTGIDIAPAAYDNLVYTSTVPGTGDLFYAPGGIGYIYGLDQQTGAIRWNVSTVDSPDLWGHPEVNSGGGCWYTPAIDTKTGMMFWGIANPAPFPGTAEWPSGSSRPGPNLYTNSMMALDHATGTMDWFTQVAPHDLFDHDLQIAPILASANVSGKSQEIVLGAGKMGKVYAFNRSTGALLWQTEVGNHNGNATLDVLPPGTTTTEPAVIGGVETPMAYADGVVYVPVINMITNWTPTSLDFSSFNVSEGTGELVALDVNTGKKLWVNKLDSINVGSAMVVNDLVFTATFDGTIYAFNRTDGAQVWTYKAPSAINGWPAVAGDTIVWPAGGGGSFGNNATPQLLAFSLGGRGNQTGGNQSSGQSGGGIPTNGTPSVTLTSPTDATFVTPGNVTVIANVTNFTVVDKQGNTSVPGEGHLHFYMDVSPLPSNASAPAIPADPNAAWAHVSGTVYTFSNVTPGAHTFAVQLVNNDHTPVTPIVTDTVTVTATGTPATTTVPTTMAMTTAATTAATTAPTTTAGGSATVSLTAQNIKFDKTSITVPAGAEVTMTFNNQDAGVPHNFAAYTDATASTPIFVGAIVNGPTTTTYTFTAPSTPGNYFFRCDVHPSVMTGTLVVT